MEELKELAKGDDRILFTGFVQGAMLDELYSNAYIYTLPSDLEGMPLSLLEAMSYGNCCLVSDIPECAEVVEDKALIFKKSDVENLREKLQDACDHPEMVMKMKNQAADFMACIRLFEGIKYVLPILHPNKKRLALIMCPEEDSASVEWARQKDENWVNKDITSLEFVENIFRLMNWNRECRYKVLGRVANSDQGLCMLFDLEEAIMFTPKPQEYADPLTGEMDKSMLKSLHLPA